MTPSGQFNKNTAQFPDYRNVVLEKSLIKIVHQLGCSNEQLHVFKGGNGPLMILFYAKKIH